MFAVNKHESIIWNFSNEIKLKRTIAKAWKNLLLLKDRLGVLFFWLVWVLLI